MSFELINIKQIGKRYGPFDLSAIPIGNLINLLYTSNVHYILYFINSQELIVQENQ